MYSLLEITLGKKNGISPLRFSGIQKCKKEGGLLPLPDLG
jgi:hypothetical protein